MGGHLFITKGDATKLACDAWLLPTGSHKGRNGHTTWRLPEYVGRVLDAGEQYVDPSPSRRNRISRLTEDGADHPAVWAAHTGESGAEPVDWFVEPVIAFIHEAAKTVQRTGSRAYPLLAIPMVGTRDGGLRGSKGELVKRLVVEVLGVIKAIRCDVVLVTRNSEALAAAQHARAKAGVDWREMEGLQEEAEELGRIAARDQLVLFLGAGVSIPAGLPDWKGLLESLVKQAWSDDPKLLKEASELDPLDAGELISRRLGQGKGLTATLQELLASKVHSLQHQLLASLPVTAVVTTNYDGLFEDAWAAALPDGEKFSVLPGTTDATPDRWLLKLHGSVTSDNPSEVVLGRSDYMRFERQSVALAGLVQAMMLTRHMLFVGFSLSDPNFHRIVEGVRQAIAPVETEFRSDVGTSERARLRRPSDRVMGTVVTPSTRSLHRDLWESEIRFASTADVKGEFGPAVRRLEIFLDRVLAEATRPTAYLLDQSYAALLDDEELELSRALADVRDRARRVDSRTREVVDRALAQFSPDSHALREPRPNSGIDGASYAAERLTAPEDLRA
jgi:hypothetical protein